MKKFLRLCLILTMLTLLIYPIGLVSAAPVNTPAASISSIAVPNALDNLNTNFTNIFTANSWEILRNTVNVIPANTATMIQAPRDPPVLTNSVITIPVIRQIMLVGNSTANTGIRTSNQANNNQQHFIFNSNLIIDYNITLSGKTNAGDMHVDDGETLTLQTEKIIDNIQRTSINRAIERRNYQNPQNYLINRNRTANTNESSTIESNTFSHNLVMLRGEGVRVNNNTIVMRYNRRFPQYGTISYNFAMHGGNKIFRSGGNITIERITIRNNLPNNVEGIP